MRWPRSQTSLGGASLMHFRQQTALVPLDSTFTGTLHRQAVDILLIAGGAIPRVVAREPCLGRDAAQRN